MLAISCLFATLFVSQGNALNSSIDATPDSLVFVAEECIWSFSREKITLERTLVIEETSGHTATNLTLKSTAWYGSNSSDYIPAENVNFSINSFNIPPRGIQQIIVTLEVPCLKAGSYKGHVFISGDGIKTLMVESTLVLYENLLIKYSLFFAIIAIVIIAFWILLRRESHKVSDLLISLLLIVSGLGLIIRFEPFGPELNALLATALFFPLITYVISILKARRDFGKQIDKASHDYRRTMVEKESSLIGSFIGELSTHAASFAADDWPEPRKLSEEEWKKSDKVGLISDIHTHWIAKYYHYVPFYNSLIAELGQLTKKLSGTENSQKLKVLKESLSKAKQAYLETETLIYHMLLYDLGLLQQRYLARPAVLFPIHMSILLRKKLENFGITDDIYSKRNAQLFNLRIGKSFNASFAQLEITLKSLFKAIETISKGNSPEC